MVKSLPKVLYHGTKVFAKSLYKSIQDEIEMSRQAAKARYSGESQKIAAKKNEISLRESKQIMNVDELDRELIQKKYKYLFHANSPSNGGSLYLQSKIFRAKERIDKELNSQIKNENKLQCKN